MFILHRTICPKNGCNELVEKEKNEMNEIEEVKDVPDESEHLAFGLTKKEARTRLKHIAGLCYSLSCDILNLDDEVEFLREENAYLRNRLKEAGIYLPPPVKSMNALRTRMHRRKKHDAD